jgi:hypothetical protein
MDAGGGKPLAQQGELPVLGAEVMPPLADAVGLVDREPPHADAGEEVEQPRVHEPFRGGEQEPQVAGGETVADGRPLVLRHAPVDRRGRVADRLQRIDLVLHQGDERRDHDVGRLPDQRRQLVAEALAPSRRHDDERVAAGEGRRDRLGLQRPEPVEAPPAAEHLGDAGVDGERCGGGVDLLLHGGSCPGGTTG